MKLVIALVASILVPLGIGTLPAVAAPDNKNTVTFEADCDDLGAITVSEIAQGQGGGAVFTEDGQVVIAKSISGTFEGSLTVTGGPTINFPPETFEVVGKGKGYADRLQACDFTQTFTDQFILDAQAVADFGLGDEFIGATATFTGTSSGTAQVIVPGN